AWRLAGLAAAVADRAALGAIATHIHSAARLDAHRPGRDRSALRRAVQLAHAREPRALDADLRAACLGVVVVTRHEYEQRNGSDADDSEQTHGKLPFRRIEFYARPSRAATTASLVGARCTHGSLIIRHRAVRSRYGVEGGSVSPQSPNGSSRSLTAALKPACRARLANACPSGVWRATPSNRIPSCW